MRNSEKIVYSTEEIFNEIKNNNKTIIYIYYDFGEKVYFLSLSDQHNEFYSVLLTGRYTIGKLDTCDLNYSLQELKKKIDTCLSSIFSGYMQINTEEELKAGLCIGGNYNVKDLRYYRTLEEGKLSNPTKEVTIGGFDIKELEKNKLSINFNGLNYTLNEIDGHLVLNRNMLCKRG